MQKTFPTDDLQVDALFSLLGRLALDAKRPAPAGDQETDRALAAELKTEHLDDRDLSRAHRQPPPAVQGRARGEETGLTRC
jgi:hypothetical protein